MSISQRSLVPSFKSAVVLAALAAAGLFPAQGRAEAAPRDPGGWSCTFTKGIETPDSYTANGVDLDFSYTWSLEAYGNYDAAKGIQIGSANKPVRSFSVTIRDGQIAGDLREIQINTSGASGIKGTNFVTVGGAPCTPPFYTLTSTATPVSFVPPADASGDIVFSYTNNSARGIYIKSISVITNRPPVWTTVPAAASTLELGNQLTIPFAASDGDGDTLVYTVDGEPAASPYVFDPPSPGATNLVFAVTDGFKTLSETLSVNVVGSNLRPTLSLSTDAVTVPQLGGTVTIELYAADDNATAPALSVSPDVGSIVNGVFTWTPDEGGVYPLTFTATDSLDSRLTATVQAVVTVGLAAPQNLVAETSGSDLTASWDAVTGAENYTVKLLKNALYEIDFESEERGSNSYGSKSGFASGPTSTIAWSTDKGSFDNANVAATVLALAIKDGTLELGPFPAGLGDLSFDYAQPNKNAGKFTVVLDLLDAGDNVLETRTVLAETTTAGQHVWKNTGALPVNAYSRCRILIPVTTNPVAFDNIRLSVPTLVETLTPTEPWAVFNGLEAASEYYVSVTANANGVSSPASVSAQVVTTGNHPPVLSVSPATAQTVPYGYPVTFAVSATDSDDGDAATLVYSAKADYTDVGEFNEDHTSFTWTPEEPGTYSLNFAVADSHGAVDTVSVSVTVELQPPQDLEAVPSVHTADLAWGDVRADSYDVSWISLKWKGEVLAELIDPDRTNGWYLESSLIPSSGATDQSGIHEPGTRKYGTSDKGGAVATPNLDLSKDGGRFSVVFDARAWLGTVGGVVTLDETDLTISAGTTVLETVRLTETYQTYCFTFEGGTPDTPVILSTKGKKHRFFLGQLRVITGAVEATETTVTGVEDTSAVATGLRSARPNYFWVTGHHGSTALVSERCLFTTLPAPAVGALIIK